MEYQLQLGLTLHTSYVHLNLAFCMTSVATLHPVACAVRDSIIACARIASLWLVFLLSNPAGILIDYSIQNSVCIVLNTIYKKIIQYC